MSRNLPALHQERRSGERLEVELPARIVATGGVTVAALVRNISTGGVLVHIDAGHGALLLPNVTRDYRHIPVCVRLELRLPSDGSDELVQVECGIAHLRRVTSGTAAMGLGFREFHGGSEQALARFCAV